MYWDASEKSDNVTTAGLQNFTEGMQRASGGGKSSANTGLARAIRRVAYTGSEPAIGAEYEGGFFAGLIDAKASPDGTATHALIVAPKSGGEYGVATSILDVAQRTFPNGLWWVKDRINSNQHQFIDSVRGGNIAFVTPNTAADAAYVSPSGTSVAWCWASNEVGYDSETGFQMIRYQGNGVNKDISHDLGVLPDMVWVNAEDADKQTYVWHKAIGATDPPVTTGSTSSLILNSSGGLVSTDAFRGQTSSIIRVGANSSTNTLNENYMMYLWKSIPGFSKFGTYAGNASTDGPFVFCGFKPAVLIVKATVTGSSWGILDNARNPYNTGASNKLYPSGSAQESGDEAVFGVDFLSNGFKPRTASGDFNESGRTFIFAAFAEAPTNNLFGGQANAR